MDAQQFIGVATQPSRYNEFRAWLAKPHAPRVRFCDQTVALAKSVALDGWRARAAERGLPEPSDLSSCCKFSSLFGKLLFGGVVQGNYDHQFNVVGGQVLDLNADAEDVLRLIAKGTAYEHDAKFMGSRDHCVSLKSCFPRVDGWLSAFLSAVPEEFLLSF